MSIAAFVGARDFGVDGRGKSIPTPLPIPADVSADIYGHLHEPGLDGFMNVETMNVLKHSQKHFLRGILSVICGAQ